MKNKLISIDKALDLIKDGDTVMYGGFIGVGTPETIVDGIVERKIGNLTIIGNDTGKPGKGVSKLVAARLVKKAIVSHIGTNPETGVLMGSGELEVELVPQGTLAERIRAGGYGLGGVLTPTGLNTDVAVGKEVITVDGKEYLLEKPLHANVAIIRGSIVDETGNVYYNGTTRNFNPLVAAAADIVIVETEKLVKAGEINPEHVMTPGILVDYIVLEGGKN
ncbi:MAG: CoA transferase subunit A [Clostridiales bacterium]|nr:CoA transferase subunit A [Clostridiales bacterium]